MSGGRALDMPAVYRICVKGTIDAAWASYWFEGFAIAPLPDGESLLTGRVADQSALLGLLARIQDLGLLLLSVEHTGRNEIHEEETRDGGDTG